MKQAAPGRFLAGLALLLVVLSAAACDVAFQGMHASATDEWRRTYKLAEGGTFDLTNLNGAIDVTPSADATTVEIVAHRRARGSTEEAAREALKAIRIDEQVSPAEIKVQVRGERGGGGGLFGSGSREVNFTVKVPKNTIVKVQSTNGAVHAAGLGGSVKLETTNGGITGEDLAGAVDASTTNGGIRLAVAMVPADGVKLDTTNGSIELKVPADAKATISARWLHGAFDARGLKVEGESERRRYEGKLNGGGPRVELSTTNGAIRLVS